MIKLFSVKVGFQAGGAAWACNGGDQRLRAGCTREQHYEPAWMPSPSTARPLQPLPRHSVAAARPPSSRGCEAAQEAASQARRPSAAAAATAAWSPTEASWAPAPLQEKQKKDAAAAANGKAVKQSAGELRLQKGEGGEQAGPCQPWPRHHHLPLLSLIHI